MSYAIQGLGQADSNTDEVRATYVGNGWTDPWLDAGLEVRNISAADAPRVPREVRQTLLDSGASVDSVGWDPRGRVHVRWKPNATFNAVEYANIAKRIFANAAWVRTGGASFGRDARVVMPRYRINNRLSAAQYVYPTGDPLPASAPTVARLPTPDETFTRPPASSAPPPTETTGGTDWASPVIMGTAALVAFGLAGAAVYVSQSRVRRNRRRRRR